jgi:hypothetical protein
MNHILFRLGALIFCGAALSGCDVIFDSSPDWHDFGKLPAAASTSSNHTPMVVTDDKIIVGTDDGLWEHPRAHSGDWRQLGLAGVRIFAVRRDPGDSDTLFAAGQPLDDAQASPFYRSDDSGETWIASTAWPVDATDDSTEPFYDLAVAADNSSRLYANLAGSSIAVSIDSGDTWTLANDETTVSSDEPCILHVLESQPERLYQGCKLESENAWVATYDIDQDFPFELTRFTYVAGGPDAALGERRPNSFASGTARPDTLYVGLEGSLIAIEDDEFEKLLEVDAGDTDIPYARIKGIWLDPNDEDHLIFGGGVSGTNSELALFETKNHGGDIEQLDEPKALNDPSVEQIQPLGADNLAVLISESDGATRSLRLFELDPGGDIF